MQAKSLVLATILLGSVINCPARADEAVAGSGKASSIGVPHGAKPLVGVDAYTSPEQPVFVAPGQPVYVMPSPPANGQVTPQTAPGKSTPMVPPGTPGASSNNPGTGVPTGFVRPDSDSGIPISPGVGNLPPGVQAPATNQPRTIGDTIKGLVDKVTNAVQVQKGSDGVKVKVPFVNVDTTGGDPDVKIRAPLVKVDHLHGQTNVKAPFATVGEPVRTP